MIQQLPPGVWTFESEVNGTWRPHGYTVRTYDIVSHLDRNWTVELVTDDEIIVSARWWDPRCSITRDAGRRRFRRVR